MIETILPICRNQELVDLTNDEDALGEFLIPFISEHRRDYGTILALGDIATIEFRLGEVWLHSRFEEIDEFGCTCIKRFTRQKIEFIASMFARTLCSGMRTKPYRPDIKKAFDYDC